MLRRFTSLCHHFQTSRQFEIPTLRQSVSYCDALIIEYVRNCWQPCAVGLRHYGNTSSDHDTARRTSQQHAAATTILETSGVDFESNEQGIQHNIVGVLVRDSSKLQPRLLQPEITPPPEQQKKPRRRRRKEALDNTAVTPAAEQEASEPEPDLSYFTAIDDATPTSLQAGFKAAQHLQQTAATGLGHSLYVGDAIAGGVELPDVSTYGDRSAALLEMEQLQELRQKRGGVLDPEDLEVVQVAKQRAARKLLPMDALASAVTNALEVGKKYGVDPKVLLTQRIAEMRTDLLKARAAQIKRMLPDTQLHEELLARRPEDLSGQITRMVAIFRKQLGMNAPADLLMSAWTFAKALRLLDYQLEHHLQLLQQYAGSRLRARQLANQYVGTVVSNSFPALIGRVPKAAAALKLTEVDALGLVLAYPFIARTPQQLSHMKFMLENAPTALGISEEQLLPAFIKYPDLFRYRSIDELVHKYHTLATLFNVSKTNDSEQQEQPQDQQQSCPATPADILSICSRSKVRQAPSMAPIVQSLRTAAAIMGFSNTSNLLPWLLRPPSRRKNRERLYGSGKSQYLNALLQPAETLAARAMFVQQQQGLDRAQIAKLARWAPTEIFLRDVKTQKLKHTLLQGQLLGTEITLADDLDDRMKAMLRKYPRVGNLQIDTILQRADVLELSLQLQQGQGRKLAIRTPQLIAVPPIVLQQLVLDLTRLLGNSVEAARQLVLQEPKVLLLLRRYQSGSLAAQLAAVQSILSDAQRNKAPDQVSTAKASVIAKAAAVAVKSAATRSASHGFGDKHGMTGVRQSPRSKTWQTYSRLVYGGAKQYSSRHATSLQAACAQDLIRLAVKGPGSAVNLSKDMYTAAEITAYAQYIQLKQQQRQQQQEEQTQLEHVPFLPHHTPDQHQVSSAEVSAVADAANAAVQSAAARAASLGSDDQHGLICVRQKPSGFWQTSSYLVYDGTKQYSSVHPTALEAACAQDLIRVTMKGPGSAVNLSEDVYTAEEVAAFKTYLQLKKQQWQQQEQMQVLDAASGSYSSFPVAYGSESARCSDFQHEELFTKCLATVGGRQLLTLKPETIVARLQSLFRVVGMPVSAILHKALLQDRNLSAVLVLSAERTQQAAAELQQQLDLSLQQLQRVLRQMPQLLLYKPGVLQEKINRLIEPFASCCYAVQQSISADLPTSVVTSGAPATRDSGEADMAEQIHNTSAKLQQPTGTLDAVECLQRAVVYAPQLLGLKTEKVARRLSVLEQVCGSHPACVTQQDHQWKGSLSWQLHSALLNGSIGRWLIAGDAHYDNLLKLVKDTAFVVTDVVEERRSSAEDRRGRSRPVDQRRDTSEHTPEDVNSSTPVTTINLQQVMRKGVAALDLSCGSKR